MKSRGRSVSALAFAIFAAIFVFLTISIFIRQSPTIDEPIHLLAGYSYLQWGDFRINPEHPPLVKIWAALPLMMFSINDPRPFSLYWNQILETEPGGPVYPLAQDMFYVRNDAATLFFYAKMQMLVVSVILAVFVYVWSRQIFGIKAAIVALFLYGLDPNILAHSAIIHTDLPFAACFFISAYFFWRALTDLTWSNLLLASLVFGLAAITKHSFIALAPVWLILGLIKVFTADPHHYSLAGGGLASSRKQKAVLVSAIFFCAVIAAYISVWASYGFRFNAVPGGEASLFMTSGPRAQKTIAEVIQAFVVDHRLFPEAMISGYLYNLKIWKHSAYLLGEISPDGFWTYFPVAFAVKTPLPTVLLSALSVGLVLFKKRSAAYAWLIVPPLVYFTLAILSRFNLGVRHLLPVYPFLFVLIGGTVAALWSEGSRVKRGALLSLGLWYLWSSLAAYPHYLAYFNELVGGSKHGHRTLLDSNLDWGQDLKGLKKWLDENAVKKIQLFYFGTAAPKYYGIDDFYSTETLFGEAIAARRQINLPEHLAISVNFLYGGELFLPKEWVELVASYRLGQPVATIGYSIMVYKLNLADPRVYENAAAITARKGALDLARLLVDKALQMDPASANGYLQLGDVLAQQGEWEGATQNFRNAVKFNPELADGHYNLGRILFAQGRVDQAIESFRETLRVKPNHTDAHRNLAQALARQGRIDEAAKHYQEALRILKQGRAK
jgi:tetratricopeptide (TPR) repeat protein